MTSTSKAVTATDADPAQTTSPSDKADLSLAKVLDQNEKVKDLVEECADDLSTIHSELREDMSDHAPVPAVETAIEKSEAVENKVMDAAEKLTVVNQELAQEVHALHSLQQKLANTVDQVEAARNAALHDVLTGLPNRALFNDRVQHGLEQAKRHGWTLAVMFVDLNGFKQINDKHGHAAGDRILKSIALRLKDNARSDDTVSRHGGDEFLYLLMGGGDKINISSIAESIIRTIQVPCEVAFGEVITSVTMSASIGVAIYPKDGATADQLIESADAAMYEAKRNKSGFRFAAGAKAPRR